MMLSRLVPARLGSALLALALGAGVLTTGTAPAQAALAPVAGGQSSGDTLFPGVGNTGYDVTHYDLDITWTAPVIPGLTTDSIAAVATIDATTTGDPLSSYSFDLEGLTVSAVTVNGAPATFTRVNDASITKHKLVITPAAPVDGAFTTVVTYSGTPVSHTDPDGSSEGWGRTPDGVIFLNQPVGAMTGFPNNNTPSDKATYEVSLDIPSTILGSAAAAVSNGELASKVVNGTRTTWNWVQQEQMATMAMLISIGRYTVYESDVALASGRVIKDYSFIDPFASGANAAVSARGNLKSYIDFFETRYGPYPGNSTGIVVDQILPTAGINYALETQDRAFFPNSVGTSTNIHEAMHQWWGDAVSPVVWNDIWISEGAASFSEVLYPNESSPQTSTTTTETANYNLWNSTASGSSNWTVPPADMGDPANLFGWQTYNRSEMTLEALKAAIGTANFDTVMFEWNDRYNGQSPGTAAFIDLAEEISGKDLTAFFQDWIYDADKPAWPSKFDLSLTPNPAQSPVAPESVITYTVTATNTGKVPLAGAVVEVDVADVLDDADINPVIPPSVQLNGTTLTWTVPNAGVGSSTAVSVPFTLKTGVTTGTLAATAAPSAPTLGGTCTGCSTSQEISYDPIDPATDPTIAGTAKVGETLTAQTSGWAADTTFTYQWTRNGEPIDGATATTYDVAADDLDALLAVVVTGSKAGFADTVRTSAPTAAVVLGDLVLTPTPTISGTPQVGLELTAEPGTWDDDVTFGYQWLVDDSAVSGATGPTYIPTAADEGKNVSVEVTGAKPGYSSQSRTSSPVGPVAAGELTQTPDPTISGTAQVGETLTAEPGTWDPGVTFAYQWAADGSDITGAMDATYDPVTADIGKAITVKVTGSKAGFGSQTRTSAPTSAVVGQLESTPTATVKGKSKVGKKLRSDTGVWDEGVTLSYQWTANGVPIAGATSPAYRIQADDLGARIRLEVTGTKPNYAPVTTTSAPTAAIRKGTLKKGPRPVVKGKAKVGKKLRFTQGSWPQSGISFTYQWFVAAKPVAGAVGKRFKVKSAYRGKRIHVRVIGSKSGYHDRKVQSVRTARVR